MVISQTAESFYEISNVIARGGVIAFRTDTFYGPLTLIGNAKGAVPVEITTGTETVGIRLPSDDKVRALIEACGCALTATSANPSHEAPAKTSEDVRAYFGDDIDLIVDDGAARTDRPSTVVDARANELKLIREGVIGWAEIQKELDKVASSS